MSDDLVRVEPPDIARTALVPRAAARAAAADRRRGARGGGKVSGVLRRTDREPAHARGVRAGRGAVPGVCGARGLGLRAIAPLHVAPYIRTHPGVGADGEAAPGGAPGALRLAGRPPGAAGEPGRVGAGAEARRHEGRDAGPDAGRGAGASGPDRHGHARRPARPGARLGDALQRRAGERGHRHAAAGLLPAGAPGVAQAPREGRHAARCPGPPSGGEALDDYLARAGLDAATARSSRASTRRGGG